MENFFSVAPSFPVRLFHFPNTYSVRNKVISKRGMKTRVTFICTETDGYLTCYLYIKASDDIEDGNEKKNKEKELILASVTHLQPNDIMY